MARKYDIAGQLQRKVYCLSLRAGGHYYETRLEAELAINELAKLGYPFDSNDIESYWVPK